ncbi:MAG: elongation factor P maturation arginine rhamnosyltransferase EarP [Gammaproteobacteria bacterium]|nr:elongation factor P maturation arginine rhamnosyltransferase EarP [Gammaproteobacteria bacterium]MDD2928588.1 elongation factor P maturation arginine rhamnosyltransferase EarP [Sideroxydans sp.]MDD5470855.1 elongation factor P maturation arginine rhamnosyltransferase EarP [Sideroxydans sp.]
MKEDFPRSCDIFCAVVDNYGDIGVCWRLARQLANEQGLAVRLWVDDLRSFGRMLPELDAALSRQTCRSVEIGRWTADMPELIPAELVIGAFACKLPESYIAAMAARERKPVWLNLEYLSAEDWVETHHQLPSPHPQLPLTKHFFFPGFTVRTGGLLIEHGLLAQRDAFRADAAMQARYWQGLGVPPLRQAGELRVSLFSYENAAIAPLLQAWAKGTSPLRCLLPEGRALPQVAAFFGHAHGQAGEVWQSGSLTVHVLPFVEQPEYDRLLWACDVNFVRGEDSCVRAQWAGKPFIWQIYPQHDGVHLEKLEALWARYVDGLPEEAATAVRDLWLAWNGGTDVATAWGRFGERHELLAEHGLAWAERLSGNNLALNLLDFYRQVA